MTQEIDVLGNDPLYVLGYNAGLDYAARWLTSALSGYSTDVVDFANNNAMSIRAARQTVEQQSFFDAVRNDPEMYSRLKETLMRIQEMAAEDIRSGRASGTYLYQIDADARAALKDQSR